MDSFFALIRSLESKLERQRKAVAETEALLAATRSLSAAAAKPPGK